MKKSTLLRVIVFGSLYFFGGGFNAVFAHKNQPAAVSSNRAASVQLVAPVIGQNESADLKLVDVLKALDCSTTALGSIRLANWLTNPMTNMSDLRARQATIRALAEDKQVRTDLVKTLQKIVASEDDYFSYLNNDPLNNSVQKFYFAFLPKFLAEFKALAKMQKSLNNSAYSLGGAMGYTWLRSLYFLAQTLCLTQLFEDFLQITLGGKEEFDLKNSLWKGLCKPLNNNWPFQTNLGREYDRSFAHFNTIRSEGSLGDRITAFTQGFNRKTKWKFWFFPAKEESEDKARSEDSSFAEKLSWNIGGTATALGYTAMLDYNLFKSIEGSYQEITSNKEIAQKLRIRLTSMAELVKNIDELHAIIKQNPIFAHSNARAVFDKYLVRKEGLKEMQELLNLLHAGFDSKLPAWYPTGSMLLAQKRLTELMRGDFLELLLAIGEIDAYVSVAQLYLKHQDSENKICFVDFIEDEMPQLDLQDVWIPSKIKLANGAKVVTNTVELGYAGAAAKMILTGPNGCGKSTLLKPLGQSVALAQGWTIAPASQAHMTIFHEIYTCFDADEDGPAGLSTFMAIDKKMVELQHKLDATKADHKCLALIDEPWRGTVDAASAKYIYDFGKHVASLPHCIVCLATHVQKPVDLARDTHGAFRNMQVTINRGARSKEFERTFKLADGPANWWFNDDEMMRSDFIDWLKQFYGAQKASA